MALEKFIEGARSVYKNRFTCSYIDPATMVITPNMSFGSTDEFQAWNDCDPPFPGWWNAAYNLSEEHTLDIWRWWDGVCWSTVAKPDFDDEIIAIRSSLDARTVIPNRDLYNAIKWNDRWPVGARVPRVIPEGHPLECFAGMIGGTIAKPLQQQLEESDW